MPRDPSTERYEVELPVCPNCKLVGHQPAYETSSALKHMCIGPVGARHKKVKMEMVPFVGVVPRDGKGLIG